MKADDLAAYATSTILSFAPVLGSIFSIAPVCIDSGAIVTGIIVSICSGVGVKLATHYIDKWYLNRRKRNANKSKDSQ